MLGGFVGAALVYAFYKDHYDATDDASLAGDLLHRPAIRNYGRNIFCEMLGTFVLRIRYPRAGDRGQYA